MEELLKKALAELKQWEQFYKEVHESPKFTVPTTTELIAEIEMVLNGK